MSPSSTDPLVRARTIARLLDSAVRIPGTNMRFGLDPVLGLVPGLGDLLGAAMSGYIIVLGAQLGAPRMVIVRMLANVAVDTVGGSLPVLGDLFDAGWKSNNRNVALLERTLGLPETSRGGSRWLVVGTVIALAVLAAAGVLFAVLLIKIIAIALR
jgi:hypothetical protein